jgi:hypothetical protein
MIRQLAPDRCRLLNVEHSIVGEHVATTHNSKHSRLARRNGHNLRSTRTFEACKDRELAVLQQLPLDLQDRTVNVVLDLVDLLALPLNVRNVDVGTRPGKQSGHRCQHVDQAS